MVRNREEAASAAERSQTNKVGTCQLWTRTQFDAPSAGDRDGDRDADAVDGWLSEPSATKHYGDRNPPRGVPVAFKGGSKDFGHRAISLGNGRIRSTDMSDDGLRYQAGNVGTTTIAAIERAMGVVYLGWTPTITGQTIPLPPVKPTQPPVKEPKPKNNGVTKARDLLLKAQRWSKKKGKTRRAKKIGDALKTLPKD